MAISCGELNADKGKLVEACLIERAFKDYSRNINSVGSGQGRGDGGNGVDHDHTEKGLPLQALYEAVTFPPTSNCRRLDGGGDRYCR